MSDLAKSEMAGFLRYLIACSAHDSFELKPHVPRIERLLAEEPATLMGLVPSEEQRRRFDKYGWPKTYPDKAAYYQWEDGTIRCICLNCQGLFDAAGIPNHAFSERCEKRRQAQLDGGVLVFEGSSFPIEDLVESMADLEHQQWAHWTAYLLQQLELLNAQPLDLLDRSYDTHGGQFNRRAVWTRGQVDTIQRWVRQIMTPYAELSEKEKDSDREWARKSLALWGKVFPAVSEYLDNLKDENSKKEKADAEA